MRPSVLRWHSWLFTATLAACSGGEDPGSTGSNGTSPCSRDDPTTKCASGTCPPGPPACGPGSALYSHATVRVTSTGSSPGQFTIYEPNDPAPSTAPVLAFVHGFAVTENRSSYESLLRHFARKGYIVIFPEYGFLADLSNYLANVRKGIADGLAELETNLHVKPNGQFGMFGHSLGAMLLLETAATADANPPIPVPSVLVLQEPAGKTFDAVTGIDLSEATLSGLDPATRLLVIEAETSVTDANSASPDAWAGTTVITRTQKNWLLVHSDGHGAPPLTSDHLGVQADATPGGAPLDAIDFWGYYRPTEAAFQEAFRITDGGAFSAFCSSATAACDAVRDMGRWSDGTAVARIENAGDRGL